MSDVVELASRRKEPHLSGKARCAACRYEWVQVAPVGVDWMECPQCHLMKGRYLHPAIPEANEEIWQCACGCDVFMVTRKVIFCINCGTEQAFP